MGIKEKYEGCLGEALLRRRTARRERDEVVAQARQQGAWLQIIVNHLRTPQPCQAANENNTLVLRTPTPPHLYLYPPDGDPTPMPHASTDELVALLNRITALQAEIAELDTILQD